MSEVRIAELKAHLSAVLRRVRRGHEVVVFDRDEPIARLVPYDKRGRGLVTRSPAPGSPTPGQFVMPPPLRTKTDAVALLLEDRRKRR